MFYFLIQVVTQHLFLGTLETEITLLANTVPHTYAATGDYNVVLTASNLTSGCPDSKDSATVHIRTIVANFTTDTLLCGEYPMIMTLRHLQMLTNFVIEDIPGFLATLLYVP